MIGRSISEDVDQRRSRIVGVVADAAEKRLTDAAEPVRYVALAQMPWIDDAESIVLRMVPGVAETSLLEPARRTIARVAHAVAVQQTTTMRRVLDTLRTRFDRILIDMPPIAPLADVTIASALADGVLMIVRAGVTPKLVTNRIHIVMA